MSFRQQKDAVIFDAGTYYIGDLCYIGHDFWDEFCEKFLDSPEKICTLDDGRSFWWAPTAYGDGSYYTSEGNYLDVDAGLLGIIPVHLIANSEISNIKSGMMKTFDTPFTVQKVGLGEFHFGVVYVNTDDEEIDEADEWDYWRDDEYH